MQHHWVLQIFLWNFLITLTLFHQKLAFKFTFNYSSIDYLSSFIFWSKSHYRIYIKVSLPFIRAFDSMVSNFYFKTILLFSFFSSKSFWSTYWWPLCLPKIIQIWQILQLSLKQKYSRGFSWISHKLFYLTCKKASISRLIGKDSRLEFLYVFLENHHIIGTFECIWIFSHFL